MKAVWIILIISSTVSAALADPLTLERCIDLALKQNPEIILARENQQIAKFQTRQAKSLLWPKVSFNSSNHRLKTRYQDTLTSFADEFLIQQTLYSSQVFAALKSANYGIELANHNLSSKINDTIFITKQAYINVLKTGEILKVTLENKKLIEKFINQTNDLISAGMAIKADLLKVQLRQENIEQAIINAKNAIKLSRQQLNFILGFPINYGIEIEPLNLTDENNFHPLTNTDYLKKALLQRHELEALDYQIKLHHTQITSIASTTRPQFFLVGNLGLSNDKLSFDLERDKTWSIGAIAQWNFFDGGNTRAKIDETKAIIRKLEEQRKQLVNSIDLEINLSLNEIDAFLAKIKTSKKEVELAQKNLQIENEKYINGLGTSLQLLESQTDLLMANTNLINAQYDLEIAKAKLNKAVGNSL